METFIFKTEVKLADIDGVAIAEGSVLEEVGGDCRGVVVEVGREGGMSDIPGMRIGDIRLQTAVSGVSRVTNRYGAWRHVPRNKQTYRERFLVWCMTPFDPDKDSEIPEDEQKAANAIMALLPDDVVDWDWGPWPDRLDDALDFLVEHLSNGRS